MCKPRSLIQALRVLQNIKESILLVEHDKALLNSLLSFFITHFWHVKTAKMVKNYFFFVENEGFTQRRLEAERPTVPSRSEHDPSYGHLWS